MQSSRRLCSLLAALALSFFAIATAPTRAYAEWQEQSGAYTYMTNSVSAGSLKVGPIVQSGKTGHGSLIHGSLYTSGSTLSEGPVYNTKPTGAVYVVYVFNSPNHLSKGNKVVIKGGFGYFRGSTSSEPTSSSQYSLKECTVSDMRFFVSNSDNGNQTEVQLDATGALPMPFDATYLFVACRQNDFANVMSGISVYYPATDYIKLLYELPSDQNEVAAINNQTQVITDTTGSDTVTSDVTGTTSQEIQGLEIFDVTHQITEGIGNALTTQETDTTVTFPGMNLAGFSIPAASIDPLELVPEQRDTIRLMVTFIFCSAFISHIFSLVQAIFGIWEYGVGVEDFGNDTYDKGYKVKSWGVSYDVDEDLGF